jgi:oligopeptide/dipeptide ABC transporter ATP-binding protein
MYAGRVVESGTVEEIFNSPNHPYTVGLLGSLPDIEGPIRRLVSIDGSPPDLTKLPPGCAFQPRCTLSRSREPCFGEMPILERVSTTHASACHFRDEVGLVVSAEASQ